MPFPAYAIDRGWSIIATNAAADRVLLFDRNEERLIEKLFLDPRWRALFVDWETLARSCVAQFRASISIRPEYQSIVRRLRDTSADFDRLWSLGGVAGSPIWLKAMQHPRLGPLSMRYAAMTLAESSDVSVSIYTPADEATRLALIA